MAQYELKMYMRNACGPALLGDVAVFEAPDQGAAMSEACRRVRQLPRHCFGALYDPAGVQVWADDSPGSTHGAAPST
jgi:hypothetical protein